MKKIRSMQGSLLVSKNMLHRPITVNETAGYILMRQEVCGQKLKNFKFMRQVFNVFGDTGRLEPSI